MSSKANCWDNAPIESFFATQKKQLVHHQHDKTRVQPMQSYIECIGIFHNRVPRHSAIKYL